MAEISVGTITFVDLESNFSTMRFKVNGTRAKSDVETLADVLDDYSDCGRSAFGVVDKTSEAAVPGGNRDRKAVITIMDEFRSVHKYEIPGFNGTTDQDKDGEHVVDPDLSAIVAAIAVYTGESYTILRSPVIQTR